MNPSAIEHLEGLAQRLQAEAGQLTIDGDAHVTDLGSLGPALRDHPGCNGNYYHGRPISSEDLISEMNMSAVDMALIWQNPAGTPYSADLDGNARRLLEANHHIYLSAMQNALRFIPAGWVDPKGCGVANSLTMVDTLVRDYGFVVIKMNPAQNRFPIDSPEVLTVVDHIVSMGAVPAFHFGADSPFTPAEGLRRVLERHPKHPFIAVHMGGGGASYEAAENLYHQAQSLGLECPNVRYVFSATRDTYIENALITYQLAGEPFCNNLFCASDAPYGRVSWNFGGFRAMFHTLMDTERHPDPRIRNNAGLFTPEVAQNYLGGNLARFLAESCKRLLAIQK